MTGEPYTHADHARRCAEAAKLLQVLPGAHVQARIGRTVCCARIVHAWDTADGVEMWQLDLHGPIKGRMSTPARNVRQCAGLDGRCSCAPAASETRFGEGVPELATRPEAGPEAVTC